MDLQAEKLDLLQQIINSNDIDLIRDLKSLLKNRDLDWFDGLSRSQQNHVAEGISELDKDISSNHEEAKW